MSVTLQAIRELGNSESRLYGIDGRETLGFTIKNCCMPIHWDFFFLA